MIDRKPWYASRTIWGALVALIAALATATGLEIEPGATEYWTEALLQMVTIIGSLIAIWGRISAEYAIA